MANGSKSTKTDKSRALIMTNSSGKSRDVVLAEVAFGGIVNSATVTADFSKSNFGELSLVECVQVLKDKTVSVHKGKLDDAEKLLIGQAFALDAIFCSLARRAQLNMGEYINAADRYMRLALKAQGQCRATLETLAAIKNPPMVFAKQANIAQGPQQINNTVNAPDRGSLSNPHAPAPACAGNSNSVQNKLLEDRHETGLDIGTAGEAGRGDPALAAVGAINWPPDA